MAKKETIQNALQEQTLNTLALALSNIDKKVDLGFVETHRLQAITNGNVNRHDSEIKLINERMENNQRLADLRQKERDRMWAIAMLALGSIIGLGSYIIYNL